MYACNVTSMFGPVPRRNGEDLILKLYPKIRNRKVIFRSALILLYI